MIKFIPIQHVENDKQFTSYVNVMHILRIYMQNQLVVVELTDYTTIVTTYNNIDMFMDRFV
jgi:hypothetical protein